MDDGGLEVNTPQGQETFLFSKTTNICGLPGLLLYWNLGLFSLGVKGPGRETEHFPQFSADVHNAWSCTSTPPYTFMACRTVLLYLHLPSLNAWVSQGVFSSSLATKVLFTFFISPLRVAHPIYHCHNIGQIRIIQFLSSNIGLGTGDTVEIFHDFPGNYRDNASN
jgi:hypothetical protein